MAQHSKKRWKKKASGRRIMIMRKMMGGGGGGGGGDTRKRESGERGREKRERKVERIGSRDRGKTKTLGSDRGPTGREKAWEDQGPMDAD